MAFSAMFETAKALISRAIEFLYLNIFSIIVQLVALIGAGRMMPPGEFGILMGAQAFYAVIGVFVGLGMQELTIRDISRAPDKIGPYLSRAIIWNMITGVPLAIAGGVVFNIAILDGARTDLAVVLAVSEVAITPLVALAESVYVALNDLRRAGLVRLMQTGARAVVAILACTTWSFLSHQKLVGAETWAWGLLAANIGISLYFFYDFQNLLKRPENIFDFETFKHGCYFSIYKFFSNINSNLDRIFVVKYASGIDAGLYNAASRAMQLGTMPIAAILRASYGGFFRMGTGPTKERNSFTVTVVAIAFFAGVGTAVVGYILSPFLSILMGSQYSDVAPIFRALLLCLPILATNGALADSLVGSDQYRARLLIEFIGLISLVAFCFELFPKYGLIGVVAARIMTGFLTIGLYLFVQIFGLRKS